MRVKFNHLQNRQISTSEKPPKRGLWGLFQKKEELPCLRIHTVFGHIRIERLTVILLFLLYMRQRVAQGRGIELENAYVIKRGHVLFHCQSVVAEELIALFFIRAAR